MSDVNNANDADGSKPPNMHSTSQGVSNTSTNGSRNDRNRRLHPRRINERRSNDSYKSTNDADYFGMLGVTGEKHMQFESFKENMKNYWKEKVDHYLLISKAITHNVDVLQKHDNSPPKDDGRNATKLSAYESRMLNDQIKE